MKYAHFFKSKSEWYVIISDSVNPVGQKIVVDSLRHARAVALLHCAKPWNF